MGSRAQNYLVIKNGAYEQVPVDVRQAGLKSLSEGASHLYKDGELFLFETNFTPMWARFGKNCTYDLEAEVALQRFLGAMFPQDFYICRVGEDEADYRGEWKDHPFQDHPEVVEIERAFADVMSEPGETKAPKPGV